MESPCQKEKRGTGTKILKMYWLIGRNFLYTNKSENPFGHTVSNSGDAPNKVI